MKRRVRQIVVFLLLGAIVNIAVAWGLSLRSWPYAQRFGFQAAQAPDQSAINWWRANAVAGFPERPATMHTLRRFGYRSLALYDQVAMQESVYFAYAAAHGWPMVSLESQHWITRYATDQFRALPLRGWPLSAQAQRDLPIVPVWPGFAVNTISYAVIVWLLVASTRAMRRRRAPRAACARCVRIRLGQMIDAPNAGLPFAPELAGTKLSAARFTSLSEPSQAQSAAVPRPVRFCALQIDARQSTLPGSIGCCPSV